VHYNRIEKEFEKLRRRRHIMYIFMFFFYVDKNFKFLWQEKIIMFFFCHSPEENPDFD
jgi:hypothetical protein